jgi:prepilin-type N-terminal cleavage/methylation domain-containing protein
MRCSDRVRGQRGFTLMEVMTAALILSALVVSIGSGWVVADRETSNLITRQKAIFVADAEMERLTTLYGTTSFGALGPVSTTGYTETPAFPSTRLIYPTTLSPLYLTSTQDYTTTSSSTFSSGSVFQVWINSNFLSSLNRAYVWVDQDHNVMGRISWTTSNISASPCTGLDTCACLDPTGLLAGNCQKLVLYLEYPYRLVSGNAVAAATLQTLTLSTIVGRHT